MCRMERAREQPTACFTASSRREELRLYCLRNRRWSVFGFHKAWSRGLLVHQVKPVYPSLAMQVHTQGNVVLHAIIGRDGAILSLQLVSGHPLLAPAAIDAVRQWRYRPYTLNGEPAEVETMVTVRFVLGN